MLTVLFSDNHVLAVAKPAGIPTVPDSSGDESLPTGRATWVGAESSPAPSTSRRLATRPPGLGRGRLRAHPESAARLTAAPTRTVEVSLGRQCRGTVRERGPAEQWLAKDHERNVVRVLEPAPGRPARAGPAGALARGAPRRVLLELVPGRTRAPAARGGDLGPALLGDLKYGARAALPDRSIALHARELELPHPTRGERIRVECEPPELAIWRFPA
jgi:23S rRNA pseudouridine1911/1915/1917 synthase